jgi:hypothetical protein
MNSTILDLHSSTINRQKGTFTNLHFTQITYVSFDRKLRSKMIRKIDPFSCTRNGSWLVACRWRPRPRSRRSRESSTRWAECCQIEQNSTIWGKLSKPHRKHRINFQTVSSFFHTFLWTLQLFKSSLCKQNFTSLDSILGEF